MTVPMWALVGVVLAAGCTTHTTSEPIVCDMEVRGDSITTTPRPHPVVSDSLALAVCEELARHG